MIYLDHASTTPVDEEVLQEMLPYFVQKFHNPSSLYAGALEAKKAIDKSKAKIAEFLGCRANEIIFTSGGTEGDNLAIFGVTNKYKKGHIITSELEHPAVLNPCRELEKRGFEVTYLKPQGDGVIDPQDVAKALRRDTILVSIMYANNEIGTIQPIGEISKKIKNFNKKNDVNILSHSDACQATGYLEMNVSKLGVDLLTINGSKIYAPKGVGALFVSPTVKISPIIFGGGQENGMRSGTQNTPLIVALGKAIELIERKKTENEKVLRDLLIDGLLEIPMSNLNGSRVSRLANNVNISFDGVEGESAVLYLDRAGIACSTGSACSSKSLESSHVLLSIGLSKEKAHCSLRFTLGRKTTRIEIQKTIVEVGRVVEKLRHMSAI